VNAAVNMRFSREVDDSTRLVLGQQSGDEVKVANAAFDEHMPCIAVERGEILQIAGVGQLVEVDDGFVGLGQPVEDKIAANETSGAGH